MRFEEWDFNSTFVSMEIFGTAVTNPNYIHNEVKSRFNSGNAGHQRVQNLNAGIQNYIFALCLMYLKRDLSHCTKMRGKRR